MVLPCSPWALASWAPFTFIGIEINKLPMSSTRRNSINATYHQVPNAPIELDATSTRTRTETDGSAPSTTTTTTSPSGTNAPGGELAGVYLGILNLYTTLPQFVATGISTVVFTVLEPGKSPELAKEAHPSEHHSTDGFNGIAVCLFIGALASLGAAHATRRLSRVR